MEVNLQRKKDKKFTNQKAVIHIERFWKLSQIDQGLLYLKFHNNKLKSTLVRFLKKNNMKKHGFMRNLAGSESAEFPAAV